MREKILNSFSGWTDTMLSVGLIVAACVAIYAAFFVRNRWIKAAILAYEILP